MGTAGLIARGPTGYENWRRAAQGATWLEAYEVPLYSDAHLTGQIEEAPERPYAFLNAVPITERHSLAHYLTMRVGVYEESTWSNMDETDTSRYHGGVLDDEISALLSLLMGARLRPGNVTRNFRPDDINPRGTPRAEFNTPILAYRRWQFPVIPRARGTHNINEHVALFDKYPLLGPAHAISLVRAARLYQDAIWVAELEPELAWLFFVSAVEVLATGFQVQSTNASDLLKLSNPKLAATVKEHGGNELLEKVSQHLHRHLRATGRFIDFLLTHLPEAPKDRPEKCFPISWDPDSMKTSFSKIYEYRSLALHDGTPFPSPMCTSPELGGFHCEAPAGSGYSSRDATWRAEDLPMLLCTFEYIVRGAILNWWRQLPTDSREGSTATPPEHAPENVKS
jgi:hypothetical protein